MSSACSTASARWFLFLRVLLTGCATRAPVLPQALQQQEGPGSLELTEVPFFPQQDYQCGPASLAEVLRYSGIDTDPEALRPRLYIPGKQGSLQLEMAAAARSAGRIAYVPPARLAALLAELQAGRPAIVLQNLGLERYPVWHFAVVIGYSAQTDRFILRSGETRRQVTSAYDLVRTWALAGQWSMVVLEPGQLPATDDPDGFVRAVAAAEAANPRLNVTASYQAAVGRWPENMLARLGLANAQRRAGDLPQAIEGYRAVLAREPGQVVAANNLADALNAYGCRSLALQTIDAAIQAAGPSHALGKVFEQTRAEILAGGTRPEESAECATWARMPR